MVLTPVVTFKSPDVQKNPRSVFKSNAVLLQVQSGLGRVPFEIHAGLLLLHFVVTSRLDFKHHSHPGLLNRFQPETEVSSFLPCSDVRRR